MRPTCSSNRVAAWPAFSFFAFFLCFFFAFYSKAGSDNTEPLQPVPLWAICDQRSDAD